MATIRTILTTDPQRIIDTASAASSFAEMLSLLGLSPTNTRARLTLKTFLEENNIAIPNYNRSATSENFRSKIKLTEDDIRARLVKGNKHLGTNLRKWILKFNLIPYQCAIPGCLLSSLDVKLWNGKELILDLDHINGDNTDNRLENLRFLCPNCHSQTETYKSKNKRLSVTALPKTRSFLEQERRFNELPAKEILLKELEKYRSQEKVASLYGISVYALKCKLEDKPYNSPSLNNSRQTPYPSVDELIAQVEQYGWEAVARSLGVSGNAVRKYLRHRKVDVKSIKTPFDTGPKRQEELK